MKKYTNRPRPRRTNILTVPILWTGLLFAGFAVALFPTGLFAGPYPPPAQEEGTTAVYWDDPAFGAWASAHENYLPGDGVDEDWRTPYKALGMATGKIADICSLGKGGEITLLFDAPIQNRDGWDFAVFENGMSDTFLEFAYIEVSSDGEAYVRFDCVSLTESAVSAFGAVDTTNVSGLAGKYRIGFGTPFDLEELTGKTEVSGGDVDLDAITHIKIIDTVGDGTEFDMYGHEIYDPYPTSGSAGFDLDAVGVFISDPTTPWIFTGGSGTITQGGCFIATAAFGSSLERHVVTLRRFRDECLLRSGPGRAFVWLYYRYSPPVAAIIADRPALRAAVRGCLVPFVCVSRLLLRRPVRKRFL